MFTPFLFVKLIHILAAIVGFGFTLTFPILMIGAQATPGATPFALRTVAKLVRVSTWAFTIAIVSGLLMGHLGALSFSTLWYSASLLISIASMGIAGAVAQPVLRQQLALLDQGEAALPELRRLGARSAKIGMLLHLLTLTLIALMIFKPTL